MVPGAYPYPLSYGTLLLLVLMGKLRHPQLLKSRICPSTSLGRVLRVRVADAFVTLNDLSTISHFIGSCPIYPFFLWVSCIRYWDVCFTFVRFMSIYLLYIFAISFRSGMRINVLCNVQECPPVDYKRTGNIHQPRRLQKYYVLSLGSPLVRFQLCPNINKYVLPTPRNG
jgi:hypothetical protein